MSDFKLRLLITELESIRRDCYDFMNNKIDRNDDTNYEDIVDGIDSVIIKIEEYEN